ncbi:hypothetical protein JTB14_013130 [Gonioctena quinquepunctata]|nr:hypothetical protein JTB14_013130 [Gonioctena quinquepunctata]
MPNIKVPRAYKRRVLRSVAQSQILYATPAWHKMTHNKKLVRKLLSVQRKMCIRICAAYRTISPEAVGVIAGVPPIDLLTKERRDKYQGMTGDARATLLSRWKWKLAIGEYGRWIHILIPHIEEWANRPYGEVDYFLTQALSGHSFSGNTYSAV